jgi:succinate dehydrogenase flavin-adding protein (antitoxin of CptAB toxin-antitoxin module)
MMTKPSPQETVQIKVSARLKKEIRRGALECDETVRTFILKALKTRGVVVADDELVDRRKVVGSR